jgi:hypothetical protein
MKIIILLPVIAFLCTYTLLGGGKNSAVKNKYVSFEISLKDSNLKAGTTGELQILLTPKKGFHINMIPPIQIIFEKSKHFESFGKPYVPAAEDTAYLDASKPVRQSFKLAKFIKEKSFTLKGTLNYYYCSESDGWCSKYSQPIEIGITVIK